MSIQHDYIRSQSESNYRNIYNYAKNHAKNCENRNFNYFITNPKTDNIAITYNVQDKDAFWGLNNCIDEQVILQSGLLPPGSLLTSLTRPKKGVPLQEGGYDAELWVQSYDENGEALSVNFQLQGIRVEVK